jgi:cytochrome c-type biogenesis protein CcmH
VVELLFLAMTLVSTTDAPAQVRRIEERFLAPCCWRENLAVHRSPDAEAMRTGIREFVKAGKTEAEIVDFYVARYGERILREPRGSLSLWLAVVPLVVLTAGALLVMTYIARARRGIPDAASSGALSSLPDIDERWP